MIARVSIRGPALATAFLANAMLAQDAPEMRVEENFKPSEPAELIIANRPIITLRAEVLGNKPAQRVRNIEKRLDDLFEEEHDLQLTDSVLFGGRGILVDGDPLMFISAVDLDPTQGERLDAVVERTKGRLQLALSEHRELHDVRAMLQNIGLIAAYTLLLLGVLWALGRLRRWVRRRMEQFIKHSMERSGIKGGITRNNTIMLIGQRFVVVLIGLLMLVAIYFWLTAVLGRFPLTRAWSEQMFGLLSKAGLWIFNGIVDALPGLAMVVVIFFVTRTVARLVGSMFNRIQSGEIEVTWLEPSIAAPTRRVVVLLLWVFALVIAYPYIPGSSTKAFQGVSVLAGLMLSMGSSGVISQAVSGLAMMFNRLIRVGECVAVGDVVTGVVKYIGYFNTIIVTGYGEEVTVPNSLVLSTKLTNLSRHGGKGVLFTTGVTIGYDAPWRQVHGMLLEAARNTADIATDPAPKVNQHSLDDFYVDYRLTVIILGPFRQTLTALHANIQDIFNANGVQIMSPHYEGDPQAAKVVPQEKRDPGINAA